MALVATLGATNANSYVTLAEANAYFSDRMHSSAWESFADPDKLLVSASQMLDWHTKWKGTKKTETQFMQWPRTGVIRPSGVSIDEDVLPADVKIAVYELAFANISTDRMADDALSGIGQLKAGSLMIKAGPQKPNQTNAKVIPPHVRSILKELTLNSFSVVRLLRA